MKTATVTLSTDDIDTTLWLMELGKRYLREHPEAIADNTADIDQATHNLREAYRTETLFMHARYQIGAGKKEVF